MESNWVPYMHDTDSLNGFYEKNNTSLFSFFLVFVLRHFVHHFVYHFVLDRVCMECLDLISCISCICCICCICCI